LLAPQKLDGVTHVADAHSATDRNLREWNPCFRVEIAAPGEQAHLPCSRTAQQNPQYLAPLQW